MLKDDDKIEKDSISTKEWDDFVSQSDYSGFMQSTNWARVKELEGWKTFRIAVKDGEKIKAAALVLVAEIGSGKKLFYSPQGPILRWHIKKDQNLYFKKLIKIISEFAVAEHAVCWRIEPWAIFRYGEILNKYQKSPVDMQPRHTALIPLINDLDMIIANFKSKTRYNIRLAQKSNLNVEIGSSIADFKIFYSVYRKTVDRKSLEHKDFSYFESICENLGKIGEAFVVNIKKDQQYIGAILLIKFGDRITYFFGGFDYDFRKYMAPYLCHYEAIKLGKELGCSYYDLWGIANTDSSEHPWHSFTEFKEKFNPIKISLVGAHDIVFDQEGYIELLKQ